MPERDDVDVDCVVVGAGFSGLRFIHELRKLGLSLRVFEAGTDVGGTWYWNRYPGARTDSEAWVYCMRFDEDLQQEWDWQERFPSQPEVQRYLSHVADRFDMRKDITFSTRVTSAVYDEDTNSWTVTTDSETVRCHYFLTATGLLSINFRPPFDGLHDFEGEWYQTSAWPKEPVDFAGKRVAVVGTGATAVQVIPEVAQQCEHLTVFQRSANYVMPGRNHMLQDSQRNAIKGNLKEVWELADQHPFAFPWAMSGRMGGEATPEERERVFQAGWEAGGFQYLFSTFDDLLVSQDANDAASEFVRNKIRAIVDDPDTAELLCPDNHGFAGKRPPLGHFYYETYNRPNVTLVGVRENPIQRITPTGVKLADGTVHEVDVIIFALGFDAVTGAMTTMHVQGRGGRTIKDVWETEGAARNAFGIGVDGFPNMFMSQGPGGAFANIPVAIDLQVSLIGEILARAKETGADVVEPTPDGTEAWGAMCEMTLNATVLQNQNTARPWFLGKNIPGKKPSVLFYFGGMGGYKGELDQEKEKDFPSFRFETAQVTA